MGSTIAVSAESIVMESMTSGQNSSSSSSSHPLITLCMFGNRNCAASDQSDHSDRSVHSDHSDHSNHTNRSNRSDGPSTSQQLLNTYASWNLSKLPTKTDLYKRVQYMIDGNINPDVQISIGSYTTYCHSVVLSIYSAMFTQLKRRDRHHLHLPQDKVTPKSFEVMYKWMIAEEIEIKREHLMAVFNAAHYLSVPVLIQKLWDEFDDANKFSEDSAFQIFMESRSFTEGEHMRCLKQMMISRVCKYFLYLVSTNEFLELNAKELMCLLFSNSINVNSEIEILFTIARWFDYDWEERKIHLDDVMNYVRFSLIPSYYLLELNRLPQPEEISRLLKSETVEQKIDDGITYNTLLICSNYMEDELERLISRYNVHRPIPRQWIYDIECPYHRTNDNPQTPSICYTMFLDYLTLIQSRPKDSWRSLIAINKVDNPMSDLK